MRPLECLHHHHLQNHHHHLHHHLHHHHRQNPHFHYNQFLQLVTKNPSMTNASHNLKTGETIKKLSNIIILYLTKAPKYKKSSWGRRMALMDMDSQYQECSWEWVGGCPLIWRCFFHTLVVRMATNNSVHHDTC